MNKNLKKSTSFQQKLAKLIKNLNKKYKILAKSNPTPNLPNSRFKRNKTQKSLKAKPVNYFVSSWEDPRGSIVIFKDRFDLPGFLASRQQMHQHQHSTLQNSIKRRRSNPVKIDMNISKIRSKGQLTNFETKTDLMLNHTVNAPDFGIYNELIQDDFLQTDLPAHNKFSHIKDRLSKTLNDASDFQLVNSLTLNTTICDEFESMYEREIRKKSIDKVEKMGNQAKNLFPISEDEPMVSLENSLLDVNHEAGEENWPLPPSQHEIRRCQSLKTKASDNYQHSTLFNFRNQIKSDINKIMNSPNKVSIRSKSFRVPNNFHNNVTRLYLGSNLTASSGHSVTSGYSTYDDEVFV